jgi:hypothetical protein
MRVRSQAAMVPRRVAFCGINLADQEHLVLAPVDCLPDEFFRTTIGIHFRCVDQRHAEVDA